MYFESSKSSKFVQKKRKHSIKSYSGRQYEMGTDLPYGRSANGAQQSMLMGKRPASLNVGPIPTKKMRTASRQRVVSPFSVGAAMVLHGQAKTDASSGDTNSFQDDQSTLRGGSQLQKSMEVESVGDMQYDSAETSVKYKKKKKAKHLVYLILYIETNGLLLVQGYLFSFSLFHCCLSCSSQYGAGLHVRPQMAVGFYCF